jgi:L-iditol 2-dehydrogenase
MKAPITMGHEFTGKVIKAGKSVKDFVIGDQIVMATSVSCGECYYCEQGHPNLCMDVAPMGFSYPGGMAEYVVLPELAIENGHVIKVPQTIAGYSSALAEPISCTVNAAENSNIQAGDTVVVVGAGPMGILNACMAAEFGAKKVILSEINEMRLAQAANFGISRLNNPALENLVDCVMEETNGIGADVAIVAAPAAFPQEQALSYVRKRGTVCLFASLPREKSMLALDSRLIHYGELRIVGSSDSTPKQVERALQFIKKYPGIVEKMITHHLPFEKVHTAFELMASGESLRVVLEP